MKRSQDWLCDDFAPPRRPDTLFEEKGYARGLKHVAGLDEVGRGPWAGPVVAAAVVFPRGVTHPDIRDSKILPAKRREELASWIKQEAVAWALGIVSPEEIDRINILRASLMAMSVAVARLRPVPELLLIDGPNKIPLDFLDNESGRMKPETGIHPSSLIPHPFQKAIVKGDLVCHSIAAASILAKVARDQLMTEMDEIYPEYGFARHKGYGSEAHADALKRLGPCPIHRRSFAPVWKTFHRASRTLPGALFAQE
jgi:ribonuclease HII